MTNDLSPKCSRYIGKMNISMKGKKHEIDGLVYNVCSLKKSEEEQKSTQIVHEMA